MRKLKIALIGGGTGGHIYPIIAVSQKLYQHAAQAGADLDLCYFGQAGDYKKVLQDAGIKVSNIAASKLRRYFSPLNVLDFFKFFIGFFQALWKLYWFMPDAVFSKGGPGALSVVYAARFYLIPLIVHESDSVPGLTNRISARKARIIDLAFSGAAAHFKKIKGQIHVVGNPVREEILINAPAGQAKISFGFDTNRPVLLVIGGSQGAEPLNDFILNNLEPLLAKFQILHEIGKKNFVEYKGQYEFTAKNFSPLTKANYKFVDYFDNNISEAMDAADLIFSRSGSGAIFEIAAKGKPSIITPLPDSAADHQKENAYAYGQTGAAVVIEQENLLLSVFLNQAEKILSDRDFYNKMAGAARDFSIPDSAEKVAAHVLEQWLA